MNPNNSGSQRKAQEDTPDFKVLGCVYCLKMVSDDDQNPVLVYVYAPHFD